MLKTGDIIECAVTNFSAVHNGRAVWALVTTEGPPYAVHAEEPLGYVLIIGSLVKAKVIDAERWRVEVIR